MDDSELDADEIQRAVMEAEVLSIFFPLVRKSLIIDTRFDARVEPLVRLVPQAGTIEERYRSICRMRPQFPRPEKLIAIPWLGYVGTLISSGAAAWIRRRLEKSGYPGPLLALDNAIQEVRRLEKLEPVAAIRGDHYHTVWPGPR